MSNMSRVIQQHCLQAIESERVAVYSSLFSSLTFSRVASLLKEGLGLKMRCVTGSTCTFECWLRNKWNDRRDIAWGIMRISFICTALTVAFFSRMRIAIRKSKRTVYRCIYWKWKYRNWLGHNVESNLQWAPWLNNLCKLLSQSTVSDFLFSFSSLLQIAYNYNFGNSCTEWHQYIMLLMFTFTITKK